MEATPLGKRLEVLQLSPPLAHETLRFFPLRGESAESPAYQLLTLADARAGGIEVTETGPAGSVPTLVIYNKREVRVLLIDGQELVGAKQNRILNSDVLVPAAARIEIPVTCVEQGRWHSKSAYMSPGKMAHLSSRSRKMSSVTDALKSGTGHRSDQRDSWDETASMLRASKVSSRSACLSDAYVQHDRELEKARAALKLPGDALGVAVFDGRRFLGLDLFDRAVTLQAVWGNLVDSYLLDHLAYHVDRRAETAVADPSPDVAPLLATVARATWENFASPGEGKDLRWQDEKLVAAALAWEERQFIHLQVFPRRGSSVRPAAPSTPGILPETRPSRPPVSRPSVPQVSGTPARQSCPRCGFTYGTVLTDAGLHCNHCGHDASQRN